MAKRGLYHERQTLFQCGRHALNNLLGERAFTTEELDSIAVSVAEIEGAPIPWLSLAHRWPILGNHDANVICMALQRKNLAARFWDARDHKSLPDVLCDSGVIGLILNVVSRHAWMCPIKSMRGRHWKAVCRGAELGSPWVDSDSELPEPVPLPDNAAALAMLEAALEQGGHVLVVRRESSCQTY